MSKIVLACDLDNTLLYSYKHKSAEDICVEWKQEKPQGFMSRKSYGLLKEVTACAEVIPVTTRSIAQYRRIQWPNGCEPTYALTTNGAILLKKSEIHEEWLRDAQQRVAPYRDELNGLYRELVEQDLFIRCRIVDDTYLFLYCKPNIDTNAYAESYQKKTSLYVRAFGRKLYFFPPSINKGTAVKRIRQSLSPDTLICAGDSKIDVPMLQEADIAIVPSEYIADLVGKDHTVICNPNVPFSQFVLEKTMKYAAESKGYHRTD